MAYLFMHVAYIPIFYLCINMWFPDDDDDVVLFYVIICFLFSFLS